MVSLGWVVFFSLSLCAIILCVSFLEEVDGEV